MVKESSLRWIEKLLEEEQALTNRLREAARARQEYDEVKINKLENDLAHAYDEQQRLFTVISSLGKTIQNLERSILTQGRSRNFNIENSTQLTTQNQRREF